MIRHGGVPFEILRDHPWRREASEKDIKTLLIFQERRIRMLYGGREGVCDTGWTRRLGQPENDPPDIACAPGLTEAYRLAI